MQAWTAGLTFATLAILSVSLPALAAETPTHEDVSKAKEFLFVQNAAAGSFADGRLSLVESGPILFNLRMVRTASSATPTLSISSMPGPRVATASRLTRQMPCFRCSANR